MVVERDADSFHVDLEHFAQLGEDHIKIAPDHKHAGLVLVQHHGQTIQLAGAHQQGSLALILLFGIPVSAPFDVPILIGSHRI